MTVIGLRYSLHHSFSFSIAGSLGIIEKVLLSHPVFSKQRVVVES